MPAGQHKPGYRRPRTGERRQHRKPLTVDRMPQEVRDAIQEARAAGRTWEETTEAAAAAARKLGAPAPSEGAVHRWYDLRVAQVQREVMAQAESARTLAAAFASKGFAELPESALNALASEIFSAMEAEGPAGRQKALLSFGVVLSKLIAAQAADKRAELEGRKLKLAEKKFEDVKSKAEKATSEAANKIGKGKRVTLADINRIRERFGLPPADPGAAARS